MTIGKRLAMAAMMAMATHAAAWAENACPAVKADSYSPISMQLLAEHTDTDPDGIWSQGEMWNPFTPDKTMIWSGSLPACGGVVVVSQIVNRQCSSATECPARLVFRQNGQQRVLLDYKQVCTLHRTIRIRQDLGVLEACGQRFSLRAPQR